MLKILVMLEKYILRPTNLFIFTGTDCVFRYDQLMRNSSSTAFGDTIMPVWGN